MLNYKYIILVTVFLLTLPIFLEFKPLYYNYSSGLIVESVGKSLKETIYDFFFKEEILGIYQRNSTLVFKDSQGNIIGTLKCTYIIKLKRPLKLSFYLEVYLDSNIIDKIWYVTSFNGVYVVKWGLIYSIPPSSPCVIEISSGKKQVLIQREVDATKYRYTFNRRVFRITSVEDIFIYAWFAPEGGWGSKLPTAPEKIKLPITRSTIDKAYGNCEFVYLDRPVSTLYIYRS